MVASSRPVQCSLPMTLSEKRKSSLAQGKGGYAGQGLEGGWLCALSEPADDAVCKMLQQFLTATRHLCVVALGLHLK